MARDYRLTIDGETLDGLYVQGATESTHGLGSTLLSNVAIRSGEILDGIVAGTLPTAVAKGA
jgi:L-ornithine N5-oxygenase